MPCPRLAEKPLKRRQPLLLAALITLVLPWSIAAAGERRTGSDSGGGVKIALHYDLFVSEGSHLSDASGNNHDGTLTGGEIVLGKRKNAIKFDGKGAVLAADSADPLRPESRALTVGALCHPATPDGVVVSMGDKVNGFSLYLKDGVPHFAVRSAGKLTDVADTDPVTLNQWVHLIGAVDARGEVCSSSTPGPSPTPRANSSPRPRPSRSVSGPTPAPRSAHIRRPCTGKVSSRTFGSTGDSWTEWPTETS
jgi:hypothetical protein